VPPTPKPFEPFERPVWKWKGAASPKPKAEGFLLFVAKSICELGSTQGPFAPVVPPERNLHRKGRALEFMHCTARACLAMNDRSVFRERLEGGPDCGCGTRVPCDF
jgi:hypothetical protein